MDRGSLLQWGKSRIEQGLRMDTQVLGSRKKKQIREVFGSHPAFLEALGILDDYKAGKYRRGTGKVNPSSHNNAWTKDMLIAKVQEEYQKGNPVNYSHIEKHWGKHFAPIINKLFGSHKQMIVEAGLSYDEIKGNHTFNPKDAKNIIKSIETSQLGYRFEELLGELFTDLGKEFTKYNTSAPNCEPDFIFSDHHWADAKLSVNTDTRAMRKKYLKYCNRLTIFHLIGDKGYHAILSDGTERVSIFAYLKNLDIHIQEKYLPLFSELEQEYYQAVAV